MIARPATALGCRSCRNAIFRALTPSTTAFGPIAQKQSRVWAPRSFSSQRLLPEDGVLNEIPSKSPQDAPRSTAHGESPDTPWFLEVDPPRHPPSQHSVSLPKTPENGPSMLDPMIKYVYEDMGLDDISLLDLRDLDPPAALGPNLIMLFGTARSERHLHVSAGRFVRWLGRNHDISARADGLIGPGELRTKLRRLRKKAKLKGTNASMLPGGDNGISTGWVCVNLSVKSHETSELANFDDSGRLSGFGAPQTGTTIVVQCMTESRRQDLNLETLWRGILKRSLEHEKKIKGQTVKDVAELDALVSSKIQLPSSPAALQWQAMERASQQRRQFSTTARRLQSQPERTASPTTSNRAAKADRSTGFGNNQAEGEALSWGQLRRQVFNLQTAGISANQKELYELISAIFESPLSAEATVSDRLAVADQLLLTASERGVPVWSRKLLVHLIEAILSSPAYGPELQRAQRNIELLLTEMRAPLDQYEVLRLMTAYGRQREWHRFWDAFRIPPRFGLARAAAHYELAYRTMAATQDARLCTDALRWVYPEMLKESIPVWPTGTVYQSLRACVLVADPAAEDLLHHPPPQGSLDLIGQRRLKQREFVKVLREVEQIRSHITGVQAREQSTHSIGAV